MMAFTCRFHRRGSAAAQLGVCATDAGHQDSSLPTSAQPRELPIIGAGGIHSVTNAQARLAAGASLVQLYTGFIYEAPALVSQIDKVLARG